jgi:acyl-CoA synthetase (AMP-forming)/AMP-acid ligase II/acyl carrier protein
MQATLNTNDLSGAASLVDVLRQRSLELGDKLVFSFLLTGDGEEVRISYRQLDRRAQAIAASLQSHADRGDRALLLYPPGLEFIEAFFGCLYAGMIAVPVSPPRRTRAASSLTEIFRASSPALVLSTADHWQHEQQTYAAVPGLMQPVLVLTDEIHDDQCREWHDPQVDGSQVAFLQYTSGSTSTPKGVMLSHKNLLSNSELIRQSFGSRSEGWGVSWLPLYHDMGLIGGMIQPLYCGGSTLLLAPAAFLQRPLLWLDAVSRTRSIISGGPDFAYELCARRITPAERAGLDLSCWEVAFTGAEPIRARTLDHFTEAFASCGFRRETFYPCYGLAEATLIVTGGPRQTLPTVVDVDPVALAHHSVHRVSDRQDEARTLVASGGRLPGQRIEIVHPDAHVVCPEGRVGEIWVQGPSVAQGYYGLPEVTEATFGARLADTDEGPFLRTGDLGFLDGDRLYVTGRLKDLIIIRGRNFYPQDIEHTVERSHDAFRTGYCAALTVDDGVQEQLVIVQEIEPRRRDVDLDAAIQAIRRAVAAQHELQAHAIVLAKAGVLPKTTSGKTRRFAVRELYLDGKLQPLAQWLNESTDLDGQLDEIPASAISPNATAAQIQQWLVERLAVRTRTPRGSVSVTRPFAEFGMTSLDAVEISADLQRWLGRSVAPTVVYHYPNIETLAQWLASPPECAEQPTVAAVNSSAVGQPEDDDPQRIRTEVLSLSEDELVDYLASEMAKQEGP